MIVPYGMLEEAVNLAKLLKYINDKDNNINSNFGVNDYNELSKEVLTAFGGGTKITKEDLAPYGVTEYEINDACKVLLQIADENNKQKNRETFTKFCKEHGVYGKFNENELLRRFQEYLEKFQKDIIEHKSEDSNNKNKSDAQIKYDSLKKLWKELRDSYDWKKAKFFDDTLLDLFNFQEADVTRTWRKMVPKFMAVINRTLDALKKDIPKPLNRETKPEKENKDNQAGKGNGEAKGNTESTGDAK